MEKSPVRSDAYFPECMETGFKPTSNHIITSHQASTLGESLVGIWRGDNCLLE